MQYEKRPIVPGHTLLNNDSFLKQYNPTYTKATLYWMRFFEYEGRYYTLSALADNDYYQNKPGNRLFAEYWQHYDLEAGILVHVGRNRDSVTIGKISL